MRKFTKENIDLPWCFPNIVVDNKNLLTCTPERRFNEFEDQAKNLLESAHGNKEVFTRDDMIDAFMKGTSVATRTIAFDAYLAIRNLKELEILQNL